MTAQVAPARPGLRCMFIERKVECRRPAWREYVDVDGVRRGFCTLAGHAFGTVEQHPARPGTEKKAEPGQVRA